MCRLCITPKDESWEWDMDRDAEEYLESTDEEWRSES